MQYTLVESSADLAALVERFAGGDAVIVDTEFMRRDTFYPQVALVQLCFPAMPDMAWLIDPLAVEDLEPLAELLQDEKVIKVVHSASEDLEVFQTSLGCQPVPLFDTQKAAALVGLGFGLGYRRLVEQLTGQELDKDETRSDWLKRPLTPAQLDYASADVIPLLPVFRDLQARADARDRLDWILEEGAIATASAAAPSPPSYLKVKSAWKLKPRQLAVLRAICDWRDTRARELDKPRSWILADKICLAIAQRLPRSEGQLRNVPDMPHAVVRKQGHVLLESIESVMGLDEGELPSALPGPLNAPQRDLLKRLKQAAAELARQWQVEPEALLPSRDYETMVRLGSGEEVAVPPHWSGWRRDILIEPLLELAQGGA